MRRISVDQQLLDFERKNRLVRDKENARSFIKKAINCLDFDHPARLILEEALNTL